MDNFDKFTVKVLRILFDCLNVDNSSKPLPKNPDGSLDYKSCISLGLEQIGRNLPRDYGQQQRTIGKCNEKSSKLRAEANKLFTSTDDPKILGKALELYTRSIAYALPNSQELALSFANRSAVLLALNYPEESILNIERALQLNNYPEKSKPKLLIRQAECYSKLATKSYTEAKCWLSKVVESRDKSAKLMIEQLKDYPSTLENGRFYDEECLVPELESPSSKYPCASDAIDVAYSDFFGRHIIATRDIDVGELLIVEKPYLRFLDKDKLYTNCSHCLAFAWTVVPCKECVNVIFCSEECKSKAWDKYHGLECPIFGLLMPHASQQHAGRCARLLFQMHHEAGGLEKFKDRVKDFNKLTNADRLEIMDRWHQTSSLESVLNLETNEDRYKPNTFKMIIAEVMSTFMTIATRTDFFGEKYKWNNIHEADAALAMSKDPEILLFGQLAIKLALVIRLNSIMSEEWSNTRIAGSVRGSELVPFVSFLSHSCFPTSLQQCKRNHQVIYTAFPIKKGEQVSMSYRVFWIHQPRIERQADLRGYHFLCSCRACVEDWPPNRKEGPHHYFTENMKSFSTTKQRKYRKLFYELYSKSFVKILEQGVLTEKDKKLSMLCDMIRIIYKEGIIPCTELGTIYSYFHHIYRMVGNVAKIEVAK